VGQGKRGGYIRGSKSLEYAISPAIRGCGILNLVAIDLEATIEKIQNPVVVQPGSRVQAPFALPVMFQAGIRDFDDQHS
jgi:hypothetical protein